MSHSSAPTDRGAMTRTPASTPTSIRIGCDAADDADPCVNARYHFDDSARHHHDHTHDEHDHQHGGLNGASAISTRPLAIALGIAVLVLIIEIVGGVLSGSLALLADAGHVATDSASLVLALIAGWLARKPATAQRTFGYRRAGVIAAFVNAAALFLIAIWITYEAIGRIGQPPDIASGLMLVVAVIGLLANAAMLKVLSGGDGHSHDLNTNAARLHVLGDFLGSIGAIAAALIMLLTGWYLADPILSILVSLLILRGAWTIFRDATDILLDAAPSDMSSQEIGAAMLAVDGVSGIHDLHIWTVSPGQISLTGHVELTGQRAWDTVLPALITTLGERFGITHATLQPEPVRIVTSSVTSPAHVPPPSTPAPSAAG